MPIREIRHPLIRHKLGLMRRADISTKNFRELAQEVGALLTYEATSDLTLETYDIDGWCGTVQVEKIAGKKITVVPILRAGIGMLEGVLSLIPGAKVSAVGIARNEETLQAHTYLEKLVPEARIVVGHGQLNEMPVNGIHSCGRPLDPRNSTSTNTPATRIWSTSFCFEIGRAHV